MLGEAAARAAGAAIMGALRASELRRRQLGDLPRAEAEALLRAVFAAGHEAALGCSATAPLNYAFPLGSRCVAAGSRQRLRAAAGGLAALGDVLVMPPAALHLPAQCSMPALQVRGAVHSGAGGHTWRCGEAGPGPGG